MAPGDEVVCVGARSVCKCRRNASPEMPGYSDPEEGRHYIVGEVHLGVCACCGTFVPAMAPVGRAQLGCPPPYSWPQEWFRPLEYDEDESIADAGVVLPVRVEETV